MESFAGQLEDETFLLTVKKLLPMCDLLENVPLKNYTTMRVGGPARFFAEPPTLRDLQLLLRCARESNMRHFIIGAGANLLVDDGGFHGLVLRLRGKFWERVRIGRGGIYVRGGLSLKRLAMTCCGNGIGGYEFCDGIPGTVGGAIATNAGAFSSSIGDFVEKFTVLGRDGKISSICGGGFSYRKSPLRSGYIVLSATLRRPTDFVAAELIALRRDEMAAERKKKQPRGPSAGSIFRNPPKMAAGKLIEEVGLKGQEIGGVQISTLHGNFIMNRGHGSCSDVLALIFLVKRAVMERFKIDLETEVYFLADLREGPL